MTGVADPIAVATAGLAGRLRMLGRRRGEVVQELRDGLEDSAAGFTAAGLPVPEARARAVAEFGDLDVVAQHYTNTEVGRRGMLTGGLLGVGYTLVLLVWTALAVLTPGGGTRLVDLGFVLVGGVAVGAAAAGCLGVQRRLRRGACPHRIVLGLAVAALAVCLVTWVLSYLSEPWTTTLDMLRGDWRPVRFVELLSAGATAAIVGSAVRSLRVAASRADLSEPQRARAR